MLKEIRRFVPTLITAARLLSPLYLIAMFYHVSGVTFVTTIILVAFTDWLDGFLARSWKCESPIGAVLDVIADKVFCVTLGGFGLLLWEYDLMFTIAVIILGLYHLLVLATWVGSVEGFATSNIAKTKMLFEMIALIVCASIFVTGDIALTKMIGLELIWIAAMLSFYAGLNFIFPKFAPDLPRPSMSFLRS